MDKLIIGLAMVGVLLLLISHPAGAMITIALALFLLS